jgi:hypothetical protein
MAKKQAKTTAVHLRNFDADLHQAAKKLAHLKGCTVQKVFEDAVRRYLKEELTQDKISEYFYSMSSQLNF